MKFKIKFNETALFRKCEMEKQYLSHSKEKIETLFKEVFEVKDYKGQPSVTRYRAEGVKDILITELFGSSQLNFFRIEPIKIKILK